MSKIIKDMYDLPIGAFMDDGFWEKTKEPFLLSFGRVMKEKNLGMDCFDVLFNYYKTQSNCSNIDELIKNYLVTHKSDFMRNEIDFLVPKMKNGLYYSKNWGDYV